jgi:hypothetical protein
MEDFKQYLSEGADEQERDAAKQVVEGLAGLKLENKVAVVAAERRVLLRRRFWTRLASVAALVVIAGVAFWFFSKKEMAVEQIQPSKPLPEPIDHPQQTQSLSPDTIHQSTKTPIAKRPIVPAEQEEKPLVRSVKPTLDPETNKLINTLLKITLNNDSAYNLKNSDPRMGWGKIVEFLRRNNYLEAKAEILNFCGLKVDGECAWLMGIALLEEGKPDEALQIFERIAKDPDHHRRKEATLVVEALR